MKRAGKWLLRVLALALGITLSVFLVRYGWDWFSGNVLKGKYQRATEVVSREMLRVGDLTAVKHTENAVMESSTKALLIGDVQTVSVPYAYEIGLGVSLKDVTVAPGEDALVVTVPEAAMMYDSFQVTGEPQVSDFLYPLSEGRYQEMLDDEAADCRKKYLDDPACMENAWQESCARIRELIEKCTGEQLNVTFRKPADDAGMPEKNQTGD